MPTTWRGPLRAGPRRSGAAGEDTTLGQATLHQMATVAFNTSGASGIVLPPCFITDIVLNVRTGTSAAQTTGAIVRIGACAASDTYGSLGASAAGVYRHGYVPNVAASGGQWNVRGTATNVFIDVTAGNANSAAEMGGFEGLLTISYFLR